MKHDFDLNLTGFLHYVKKKPVAKTETISFSKFHEKLLHKINGLDYT